MQPHHTPPILIFCEGISYGHAVRSLILAQWLEKLNPDRIRVACPEKFSPLFVAEGFDTVAIDITDPVTIYKRLRQGRMMYEKADLLKYFEQDDRLIQQVQPQLIVSDFRFTALQLAKKYGIPSVSIAEATVHPHFVTEGTIPDPFVKPAWIPLDWLDWLARSPLGKKMKQQVTRNISLSLREASASYGVEVLPTFFDYASQGDICLLCDHPDLIPIMPLRPGDLYTGALLWENPEPLPSEIDRLDPTRKTVYVSLGTQESLPTDFLELYIKKLLEENLQVIVSLGKRSLQLPTSRDSLFGFEFINDSKLLPLVDLMVYPGGQMSTYQALSCGVPLIALPAHANQHFYAEAIVRNNLGCLFRPSRLNINTLLTTTLRLLNDPAILSSTKVFQQKLASFKPETKILSRIEALIKGNLPTNSPISDNH